MDGLWDAAELDTLFTSLLRADVERKLSGWARLRLLSRAGFFRSRHGQLWQLVLSKRDRTAEYRSVR